AEAGPSTRLAVSPPNPVKPHAGSATAGSAALVDSYRTVRHCTEALCAPLGPDDFVVQSMPDASPVKWHLAHTTWFFETFLLTKFAPEYQPFHPAFGYLFNSYYNAIGERLPRPKRGLLTRPTVEDVFRY